MTLDFAPEWLARTVAETEYTGASPRAVAVSPLAPPPPCAPAHPSARELAALVTELFTEGTLSWEQLQAMSNQPELRHLLDQAVAGAPATRRAAGGRR